MKFIYSLLLAFCWYYRLAALLTRQPTITTADPYIMEPIPIVVPIATTLRITTRTVTVIALIAQIMTHPAPRVTAY